MKNIEVKDAKHCQGNCEACECSTPTNQNEIINFYASLYAESNKTVSFCCLVEKGIEEGSWSRREWFGLKLASFVKEDKGNKIIVSAPLWLLERKKITNLITEVK